jgi:ATP synthase protein I
MALRPKPAVTRWGRGLEAGLELALSVLLGVVVGYYLDKWLATSPLMLLVFLALGFAAGLRMLLRTAAQQVDSPPDQGDRGG